MFCSDAGPHSPALHHASPLSPTRTPVLHTLGHAWLPGTAKAPRDDQRFFLQSRTPSPDAVFKGRALERITPSPAPSSPTPHGPWRRTPPLHESARMRGCPEAEMPPSHGGPAAQTPRRATPNHPPLGALGCVQPSCCPRAREGLGCGGSTEHTDPREGWDLYRLLFDGFPGGVGGKEPPAVQKTRVQSLGREDTLEEGIATHASILALSVPWTEEPGGLQSVGSRKSWT